MNLSRITDPSRLRPSHFVLVLLAAAVLAGSCLLTDGPYREVLHDGQVEWGADSPMRAIVSILNLQFAATTSKGVAIKSLVFGAGAGLAMIILAFALGIRPPVGEEETLTDRPAPARGLSPFSAAVKTEGRAEIGDCPPLASDDPTDCPPTPSDDLPPARRKVHIPPFAAAQLMMLLFGIWSLCSAIWSPAPAYALGGAALLGTHLLWAFALGLGLHRRAAGGVAVVLVVICTLTAAMAVAYLYARNPTLRASYPIGNPLFLAACLIPGILIAIGIGLGSITSFRTVDRAVRPGSAAVVLLLTIVAAALMLWATYLTRSRGPAVALAAGVGAMFFFALRGKKRWIAGSVIVCVMAAGLAVLLAQREADSPTGRSATIRLRMFSWGYAFDLAVQSPLLGLGQGGFALRGDTLASGGDSLEDPQALNARLAHAHNEWLEIWCDLGSIGLVLMAAALLLTFRAGMLALDQMPSPAQRWVMIALLASLAALVVDETFNVALRLPGLPTVYYTVIGLIWAMSTSSGPDWRIRLQTAPAPYRWGAALVAAALGITAVILHVGDFQSARLQYDVSPLLASNQWDEARAAADTARKLALNPQDRLKATATLCSADLVIAETHQAEWFRLMSDAHQTDPPDPRRIALASQKRAIAEDSAAKGMADLKELLSTAPSCWNSGAWESGLYLVLAKFSEADGNVGAAQAQVDAAVAGLERELQRRPFETLLAAEYVNLAAHSSDIDLGKLIEILARPLRVEPTPPQYINLLAQLQQRPDFEADFSAIFEVVHTVQPEQPVSAWQDPWAPEKLRLAAVILFTRNRHAEAATLLETASKLYIPLGGRARVGSAACLAELADSRFYSSPDDVLPAIEMAEQAVDRAPDSEIGRFMSTAIRNRMATYLLAGGQIDKARTIMGELASGVETAMVDREIGRRYSDLAHSRLWSTNDRPPQKFPHWVENAIQWNPDFEASLPPEESARVLELAINSGADLRIVSPFVDRVLQGQPESEPFRALRKRIDESLGISTTQPSSTQPANEAEASPTTAPSP